MADVVKTAQRKVFQMNFVQVSKSLALAASVAGLFGVSAAQAQDVTGAGATFPAPIYASLVEVEGGHSLIWSR